MHVLIQIIVSIIVVYIVLSIVNSLLIEGIFKLFNQRGRFLKSQIFHFFEGGVKKSKGILDWLFVIENSHMPTENKAAQPSPGHEHSSEENSDQNLGDQLYSHILVKSFSSKRNRLPDWIDAKVFSNGIMELLFDIQKNGNQISVTLKNAVSDLLPVKLKNTIQFIIDKSGNKIEEIQHEIEALYDKYMEQVQAWYKARIQVFLFFSGLTLAAILNIDSIILFNAFLTDAELRQEYYEKGILLDKYRDSLKVDSSLVINWVQAQKVDTLDTHSLLTAVNQSVTLPGQEASINLANLPMGWDNHENKWYAPSNNSWIGRAFSCCPQFLKILFKITGIAMTAFALSFGSPFWFEILRKALRFGKK